MDAAAAVAGIVSLGIQVCQGLVTYYDGWKDCPTDITQVRDSVTDLYATFGLLDDTLKLGGLDQQRSERVMACLASCTASLGELSNKLKELRKYDRPQGLRQKFRAEVQRLSYPFQKEILAKLRDNASELRENLKLALQALQVSFQQSDRFHSILKWLSAPDPWISHNTARRKHEAGTGMWLLQSDEYIRWKSGSSRNLWLNGSAGCGKTILCSTAIEDMKSCCDSRVDEALAIFYFTFSDNRKQGFNDLLLSLVDQLGWKRAGLPLLCQAYDRQGKRLPNEDELMKILVTSIDSLDVVYLIIDALDECPEIEDVRQTVLEQLEQLAQRLPNLKIFSTSREERDIQETMDVLCAETLTPSTSLVNNDIQKYISNQLLQDRSLSRLGEQSKTAVHETIVGKADGMFRWAHCQLQEMKRLKSNRPSYVREILNNMPPTLDETYARILSNIPNLYHRDALTMLRWIAYAREPLTLRELIDTVIIDPDKKKVDFQDRGDLGSVVNILSGLISIDSYYPGVKLDNPAHEWYVVRLAHFSVKEYLQSNRLLNSSASFFHLAAGRDHGLIAQACVTYFLQCIDMPRGLSEHEHAGERESKLFPLVFYAATFWDYHASLNQLGSIDGELLLLSSSTKVRDWLQTYYKYRDKWRFRDMNKDPEFGHYEDGLICASRLGLARVVDALLDHGADVNTYNRLSGTALHAAIEGGHKHVVSMLLERGANANTQVWPKGTPLQTAVDKHQLNMISILMDYGAEMNMATATLDLDIHCYSYSDYQATVTWLEGFPAGGLDLYRYDLDFMLNVKSCDLQQSLISILLREERVMTITQHSGTVLHSTVSSKSAPGTISFLLERGADMNARTHLGEAALHVAVFKGHPNTVRTLLDRGADVEAETRKIQTPLHYAVKGERYTTHDDGRFSRTTIRNRSSHCDIIDLLLDRKARIDARDGKNRTVLHLAAKAGDPKIVEHLIRRGAEIDPRDKDQLTPLQLVRKEMIRPRYRPQELDRIVSILVAAGATDVALDQSISRLSLHQGWTSSG